MKLGVIIGRFQPLHNGHTALIRAAMEQNDKVLVLVGSAQKLPDYRNPFPVKLRIGLLESVFKDDLGKLEVTGLNDFASDAEWIAEVKYKVSSAKQGAAEVTLYTSEKDEAFYIKSFPYNIAVKDSGGLSATDIRSALYLNNEGWVGKCPEEVEYFLSTFQRSEHCKRLTNEYCLCVSSKNNAIDNHAHDNPIEPVVHACVIQNNSVLVVQRGGIRGHGQWALPGGFLDANESTLAGATRELLEETGVDLSKVPHTVLSQVLEENLNGLSTRTLGVNYAINIPSDVGLFPVAGDDAAAVKWVDLGAVLSGEEPLFYNHNQVVQNLIRNRK